jgi:hypothetical protein
MTPEQHARRELRETEPTSCGACGKTFRRPRGDRARHCLKCWYRIDYLPRLHYREVNLSRDAHLLARLAGGDAA